MTIAITTTTMTTTKVMIATETSAATATTAATTSTVLGPEELASSNHVQGRKKGTLNTHVVR